MEKALNVYEKLQLARVKLSKKELKKSGWNKFSDFDYFELSDFIPAINDIFEEVGLCGVVSFTTLESSHKFMEKINQKSQSKEDYVLNYLRGEAILKIVDSSGSSEIVFTTPYIIGEQQKGMNILQTLGTTHTYLRRYLYMMALEICENDIADALPQQNKANANKRFPAEIESQDNNKIEAVFTTLASLIKDGSYKKIHEFMLSQNLSKNEKLQVWAKLTPEQQKVVNMAMQGALSATNIA